MEGASAEMPRYQCHKQVWALEIASVSDGVLGSRLTFKEHGYAPVEGSEVTKMLVRYHPVPGDFYVVYPGDGYASLSPRKAFLEGYTRI